MSGHDVRPLAQLRGTVFARMLVMRQVKTHEPSTGNQTITSLYQGYDWFTCLEPRRQSWIIENTPERTLEAGESLIHVGMPTTHAFILLDGLMVWGVIGTEGNEVSLSAMLEGSWFGHGSLLDRHPGRANAVALRPSRVACMPMKVFDWLFAESIGFNNALVRHAFARLQWYLGSFASRITLSVDEQIARSIAGMIDPELNPGATGTIRISQEELARLAGFSRQRCNFAVNKLRVAGIIEMAYCSITVLDPNRLQMIAQGWAGGDWTLSPLKTQPPKNRLSDSRTCRDVNSSARQRLA